MPYRSEETEFSIQMCTNTRQFSKKTANVGRENITCLAQYLSFSPSSITEPEFLCGSKTTTLTEMRHISRDAGTRACESPSRGCRDSASVSLPPHGARGLWWELEGQPEPEDKGHELEKPGTPLTVELLHLPSTAPSGLPLCQKLLLNEAICSGFFLYVPVHKPHRYRWVSQE